jgi:hypothetical protein
MARQTPAEKAAAKVKKVARWREDRAYKRLNDDEFKAREQAATQKSNAFAKAAKAFTKAHLAVFEQWQRLKGTPVAPSAQGPQSHILSPAPATPDQPFEFPVAERPDVYGALSKDGTPTAPYLERRRMTGVDTTIIRQLGLL